MAQSVAEKLQVVVVTPERAVLDEPADSAVLPMFDGELGVLPGRAALIGRLGAGELRLSSGGSTKRYFVDGGFAQVGRSSTGSTLVTLLTPNAQKAENVTVQLAEQTRTTAEALPATNAIERKNRTRALERARGLSKVAGKKNG